MKKLGRPPGQGAKTVEKVWRELASSERVQLIPTQKQVAQALGISVRTVQRAIKQFKKPMFDPSNKYIRAAKANKISELRKYLQDRGGKSTRKAAARHFGVTTQTIRNWLKAAEPLAFWEIRGWSPPHFTKSDKFYEVADFCMLHQDESLTMTNKQLAKKFGLTKNIAKKYARWLRGCGWKRTKDPKVVREEQLRKLVKWFEKGGAAANHTDRQLAWGIGVPVRTVQRQLAYMRKKRIITTITQRWIKPNRTWGNLRTVRLTYGF